MSSSAFLVYLKAFLCPLLFLPIKIPFFVAYVLVCACVDICLSLNVELFMSKANPHYPCFFAIIN